MTDLVGLLNDWLWGSILIYVLIGGGVFFTIGTRFIQFRHFNHMFWQLKQSRSLNKNEISPFQALCTSLAARVGTGNLAGVAAAIYLGGPGAIFWMWLVALLGMSTAFIESTLAQLYKERDASGQFRGGPAYYIEKGLKSRWLGIIFAVCLISSFGLAFNSVQSNTIAAALTNVYSINANTVGIILAVLAGLVVFGGIRRIAHFAEITVPFMALIYLVISVVVVLMNFSAIPDILRLIFYSAFGLEQAGAGALGYAIKVALMNGIRRGLFSNEAGMGSAPNAAATASPNPNHPASQGYIQMLGVFIDTIVICTCTAMIILSSNLLAPGSGHTGIELTQSALNHHVGSWGSHFIAIAIFLFAFTSLVANYSYAETNTIYIFKNQQKPAILVLRILFITTILFGATQSMSLVWSMADVTMGLMALINILAICLLSKQAFLLMDDYKKQLNENKFPKFNAEEYPELKKKLTPGIWDERK